MSHTNSLDPLHLPLKHWTLIEASAGTGKTYTITTLFLRLILGDLLDGEKQPPLQINQILIVTFTNAATAEIRQRIQQRLIAMQQVVVTEYSTDPTLHALYLKIRHREQAYKQLELARQMLDESAIFTIHGFCQRLLTSYRLFITNNTELELIQDERELQQQATKDFWRQKILQLPYLLFTWTVKITANPQQLLEKILPLLQRDLTLEQPSISLEVLKKKTENLQQKIQQIKILWKQNNIVQLIADSGLKANLTQKKPDLWATMNQFCEQNGIIFNYKNKGLELFITDFFTDQSKYKKGSVCITHEFFDHCQQGVELINELQKNLNIWLLESSYYNVRIICDDLKQQRQQRSTNDLLSQFAIALYSDQGKALAEAIREQYPVALIDEFQDTDPTQLKIFQKIYHQQTDNLIMIGDPKQAIYAFRGADIFTYLQAKSQIPSEQQFTLTTNYRSDPRLIAAINSLFDQPESFLQADIPFLPVNAHQPIQEQSKKVLTFWVNSFTELRSVDENKQQLSIQAVNTLAELLKNGTQVQDLAILVRDRNEATLMKEQLKKVGIKSVFQQRENIFNSEIAESLYILLQAIQQPDQERLLKAALITPFFHYSIQALPIQLEQAPVWRELLQKFSYWHQLWKNKGVLAAIYDCIFQQKLLSHWQEQDKDYERLMTDLRHLGELLQQQEHIVIGMQALIDWFAQALNGQHQQSDRHSLRLESDANLIQIVTLHGCKGLEYPIVFLPFICHTKLASLPLYHDDKTLLWQAEADEFSLAQADKERLAEDMRLLYVALTRAKQQCYVGIYSAKGKKKGQSKLTDTAIGRLLFTGSSVVDYQKFLQVLQQWQNKIGLENCDLIEIPSTITLPAIYLDISTSKQPILAAKINYRTIQQRWQLTSFTALSRYSEQIPFAIEEQVIHETAEKEQTLFDFPKGAIPGLCLHNILEHSLGQALTEVEQQQLINQSLIQYQLETDWVTVLQPWLTQILTMELPLINTSFSRLKTEQICTEMPFYLATSALKSTRINTALTTLNAGENSTKLLLTSVHGVIKGFIDCVLEHEGKFYIVDYKSNYLGHSFTDYTQALLQQDIIKHHYDLQIAIYSLALHYYLQQQKVDYQFEQHFGGVLYLYLRGLPKEGVYQQQLSYIQMCALIDGFGGKIE